jgi:hypothetical protein
MGKEVQGKSSSWPISYEMIEPTTMEAFSHKLKDCQKLSPVLKILFSAFD